MIRLLVLIITSAYAQQLSIRNLQEDPLLLVKERTCKIQTGIVKFIHPINLTMIEETVESLISISHQKLVNTNPLTNMVKLKIQQLYTTFHGLKPRRHRSRRWDMIGTALKFIAGTPDAQDLKLINYTMNELINQNNEQMKTNMQLNGRIAHLTDTINKIVENSQTNKIIFNEIEAIITVINIDSINHLLNNIQDAITLSKSSLVSNKILSLRELNTIRTLLAEQGIEMDFPDEALQFVIPKLALRNNILLYMLNVPQLENRTSNIQRIYPLVTDNRVLHQYPTHIIRRGNHLYITEKPEDFVQKTSYLKELHDECLASLIHGKQATCSYVIQNKTSQELITENSILISNAKDQILQSTCGPDNRTLNGNFLISFANCTVKFNSQQFKNNELITKADIIERAFHNLGINWKHHKIYELEKINDETIINRNKLDHVYLKQNSINLKLWSLFGGYAIWQIICIITISFILYKKFSSTTRNSDSSVIGPGRSSLKGGAVIDGSVSNPKPPGQHIFEQIQQIQEQQQQLATVLDSLVQSTASSTDA